MAGRNIGLEDLGDAIADIVKEYQKTCETKIDTATKETAKEGAEIVKAAAQGQGWSQYPSYWTYKQSDKNQYVIYAKKPGTPLVHLLEKGHRVVAWGKDTGKRTAARPHVIPSIPEINSKFKKNLLKAVES